jgi:hypothetical protein
MGRMNEGRIQLPRTAHEGRPTGAGQLWNRKAFPDKKGRRLKDDGTITAENLTILSILARVSCLG